MELLIILNLIVLDVFLAVIVNEVRKKKKEIKKMTTFFRKDNGRL